MQVAVRNIGRSGVAATAISAVDAAVWDLKSRLLGLPLAVYRRVFPRLQNVAVSEIGLPDGQGPASLLSLNVPCGEE